MLSRHYGFTLIELCITLGIVCILTFLSVQTIGNLPQKRLNSTTKAVFHAMQHARQEALLNNKKVHLMFEALNADPKQRHLVTRFDDPSNPLPLHVVYIPQSIQVEPEDKIITFYPNGFSHQRITIHLSHIDAKQDIILYDSGRVRIQS